MSEAALLDNPHIKRSGDDEEELQTICTAPAGDLRYECPFEKPTPAFLMPKMPKEVEGKDPVVLTEPATYRSLYILDTLKTDDGQEPTAAKNTSQVSASSNLVVTTGTAQKLPATDCPMPLVKAIDPFNDELIKDAELKPAVGVLTVHEQGWEQKGLALGNLLQSICLAPGEVTKVAVVRWERKTAATSREDIEQGESVTSQAEQNRSVNEVQRAVAQETQWGTSSTSGRSTTSQTGASGGFLWFGASASSATTESSVMTAQFSAGNRNIAAESTNNISQRTAEHSQALRSRRQTVVREVTEQESESLSTRVLANYNRRHTLNILFFEVLQLYKIKTQLKQWERCLFVPMKPINFVEDSDAIDKHRTSLLKLFSDLGAKEMFQLLSDQMGKQQEQVQKELDDLDSRIQAIREVMGIANSFAGNQEHLAERKSFLADLKSKHDTPGRQPTVYPKLEQGISGAEKEIEQIERTLGYLRKQWDDKKLTEKYGPVENAAPVLQKEQDKLVAKRAVTRLPMVEVLNQNRLFLSQQLWLRMSPYRIFRILQKYSVQGQPLSSHVDPQPIGVFGNYLAFRWGFKENENTEHEEFKKKYLEFGNSNSEKEDVVGLPTSGVFAEAVLGQGLGAERRDDDADKFFGKWTDKDNMIPLLPPDIAALTSRDRHHDVDFKAQDFAASLAQLRAEKLADVSHLSSLLAAVGKGDTFRDMGGLKEALSLATELGKLSAAGAKDAADQARKIQEKILDTFKEVLNSDVGKAAVAEYMAPGSGAAMLGGKKDGAPKKEGDKK